MKIKHLLMVVGVLAFGFIAIAYPSWDVTTPQGTEAKSLGDDRIRELKVDVQSAFQYEGDFPGEDLANPKFIYTPSTGTTAQRPSGSTNTAPGMLFINISSNCIEQYDGTNWNCIGVISSNTVINFSSASFIVNSTQPYLSSTQGAYNDIVNIKNQAAETNGMSAGIRFHVTGANENRIMVVRSTASAGRADTIVIVDGPNGIREAVRWNGDGTALHNSSNTFTGTNIFSSSATFNDPVFFHDSVTFTQKPAFLSYMSATRVNLADGVTTTVNFDTELYDDGSNFASSSFTAPVSGRYHLEFCLSTSDLESSTITQLRYMLNVNGATYGTQLQSASQVDNDDNPLCFSATVPMTAGNTAAVQIVPTGSSVVEIVHSTAGLGFASWFSGFQVN